MMRSVDSSEGVRFDSRELAEEAGLESGNKLDVYSDYSVGAVIEVSFDTDDVDSQDEVRYHMYSASNINLSGMEYKIHAEQLALFQAILDIEEHGLQDCAELERVVVQTSENDKSLVCGHCLQVFVGACEHYGWDTEEVGYNAVSYTEMYGSRGSPDGVNYQFDRNYLSELIPETYIENRE